MISEGGDHFDQITVLTLNIQTETPSKSVDRDQTPRSAASDLGLHSLLRLVNSNLLCEFAPRITTLYSTVSKICQKSKILSQEVGVGVRLNHSNPNLDPPLHSVSPNTCCCS